MGVESQTGGLRRSTGMHHKQERNLGRCKQDEHNTAQHSTSTNTSTALTTMTAVEIILD